MLNIVAHEPLHTTHTDEVLTFFACKLHTNPHCVEETVRAIEEWWFVPRSKEAVSASQERVRAACTHFALHGVLPLQYQQAYAFATSERCRAIEAQLQMHKT
jgi:hypothetical protein